ncbi:hypothetical protein, conserved [Trypanosoma brucei gambiense DAL972]|uniref:Uncharacterized protein n=2 Tax=Trypanosoma brucei TaxID=5691 RepID=Q385S6_TRYB2|nr:hypothetical protein, conserved [Trypanosoma brucei gambiense DAL972]XP_828567.1 hypothetical protein, conserved [Trypanosoma brucei brucei TREU927]EAN79455.1 hypothetical protein, conserved [Trypanosoma brucei brucei TREU927]CBH17436.1 hypothetical protein, conserved [Trypanosoma brucei gambiense DAL972]|eukprot:XP_011779700.1 hypothetical protein, conserved [Trypanosoma brucei gambiense DAL972]
MSTIYNAVDASTLNDRCRTDLLDTVAQLGRHCETLPKKAVTTADAPLPSCTFNTTVSRSQKEINCSNEAALDKYIEEKGATRWRTTQALASTYFKDHKPKFHGALRTQDCFRDTRDITQLSSKEKDFVHRYAEAKMKKSIPREESDDVAKKVATEAYTEAFRKFKGRDPTEKELLEVERLYFAYADDGAVGVVQKPHFHGPHMHVSICNRKYVTCPNQVYRASLPAVRNARSRFPGPIPVWTSTKNLHAVASNDTYRPGVHNVSKFGETSSK